jgi:peptidase M28-like protein
VNARAICNVGLLMVVACGHQGSHVAPAAVPGGADVRIGLVHDPRLAGALADISAARIRATDSTLVAFGTRHAMSDTVSATRGVGAARRWIFATLSGYARDCNGCLRVEYDPSTVVVQRDPRKRSVDVVNVLAWLPGRDTSRVIVMGGHYDSCRCSLDSFDATGDAPGADDDGSGSSAVIELARVFSRHYPRGLDATIVFALYSGEELGLLGSTHLAQRLHAQGYHVVAGITDDIDGNVIAEDGRVDSTSVRIFAADPDNSPSRELGRYVWALDALYEPAFRVLPVFRVDRIHRGGDHMPFVGAGDAGLRFTERLENYTRQHLPTDDFAHVNFGYTARVARLNGATIGALAAAPATPDSAVAARDASSGGQHWRVSWKPVAGAVRYEVLVRSTTAPTYERILDAGTAPPFTLAEQLDDLWASVRAVGADGARSLTATVPPPVPLVTR